MPSLVAYFVRVPAARAKSPAWQAKMVQAVGLLYDYYRAVPPTSEQLAEDTYFSAFVEALYDGTAPDPGEVDATGLDWPAASRTKVIEVLRYLNMFADFCVSEYGVAPMNPHRPATFGEHIAEMRRRDKRREHSMFAHLKNARGYMDARTADVEAEGTTAQGPARLRRVEPRPAHTVVLWQRPAFPDAHLADFFAEGFRVRATGPLWEQHNVRDLMIALLQRYAGLRTSEPFHLFGRDVIEDPDLAAGARVLLFQPEDGLARYRSPRTGTIVAATRTEFLKTVGLVPRNRAVGTALYAGWKALMLEKGAPDWYANVYWLDDRAARSFWALHRMYVRHVRPPEARHPFLFCTHSGPTRGAPYPYDQYVRRFAAAVARIGLTCEKARGTSPHGMRHAYGRDLKQAGVADAFIQIAMHHRSPDSQKVYTTPELREARAALSAASRPGQAVAALALPLSVDDVR